MCVQPFQEPLKQKVIDFRLTETESKAYELLEQQVKEVQQRQKHHFKLNLD